MVEEDFGAPARLVMTVLALLAFLALVNVVLLMAGKTSLSQLLSLWIRPPVAGPAGELLVPLFQWETGVLVMFEGDSFPVGRAMTGVTFPAKSSLMHVVFPMAGITSHRQLLLIDLAAMAVLTFQLCVPVPKREVCVFVMVERTPFPATRRMAALTFLAVASLVPIVGFVAGKTSRPEILFVEVSGMASNASDLDVPADKGKSGLRIVIERGFFPFLRSMAGLAFGAVLATMCVVQPVAVRALRRRGFVALVGVAALAADLLMGVL